MIKLTLPPKPAELTADEASLTKEFIDSGKKKSVWRKDYITEPLLKMTHDKCAYSEVRLNEESKYMEIEHIKHKDMYPEDVVRWGNLLPSCKTCNTTKGEWDVMADPIVNPLTDNPKEHLSIKACRFYAKDEKGSNTLEALGLNNLNHFAVPRFKTAATVIDSLSDKLELLKHVDTQRKKQNCINKIKRVLQDCGPQSEYSASTATFILYDWSDFPEHIAYLKSNGYWDNDFENLIAMLESLSLPK